MQLMMDDYFVESCFYFDMKEPLFLSILVNSCQKPSSINNDSVWKNNEKGKLSKWGVGISIVYLWKCSTVFSKY